MNLSNYFMEKQVKIKTDVVVNRPRDLFIKQLYLFRKIS